VSELFRTWRMTCGEELWSKQTCCKTYDGASATRAASVLRGPAVARCLALLVGFRALESVNNVMQQQHSSDTVICSPPPPLQKLSALHGNLRFTTAFTKGLHWSLSLKRLIWSLISNYVFKTHSNISRLSPPRYFRSPGQNLMCISQPSHACYVSRPYGPPSRWRYGLRSYGILRGVRRQLVVDVLGQPIGSIFEGQPIFGLLTDVSGQTTSLFFKGQTVLGLLDPLRWNRYVAPKRR
jgi:hypothetical protein